MFTDLEQLWNAFQKYGANRFLAKKLASNDNSKNQVYLGGGFEALNIIPHGEIETDFSQKAGSIRRRDKAPVELYWINTEGAWRAPDAQLILYPKYPEVRISGFLKGAKNAPSALMASRDPGRVLFMGISPKGQVYSYVVSAFSEIANELQNTENLPEQGVFLDLTGMFHLGDGSSKEVLLDKLLEISQRGWIQGQRMYADGSIRPYSAQNGGGYTLEAELGIIPNGRSEPDFMGWEVKQYAVKDFTRMKATSPVTLMTPEPTFGLYSSEFEGFMNRYGYPDTAGKPNRRNFGGIYRNQREPNKRTTLYMAIEGYDQGTKKITDMGGHIALLDSSDNIAAGWKFVDLLSHWNRKHAQAVYVPSEAYGNPRSYRFGNIVELGTSTDFLKFLSLTASGNIYLDPAVKIENGKRKKRNQFRVKHDDLSMLYEYFSKVPLDLS